jgi:hypothetical protein
MLPFSDITTNTIATLERGEPNLDGRLQQTLWYSITPLNNVTVRIDVAGSLIPDPILVLYQASGPGFTALSSMGTLLAPSSRIQALLLAGTPYYLQVGSGSSSGGMQVNLQVIPPPNDFFADAQIISALPYQDTVSLLGATRERSEPLASCGVNLGTARYAFTLAV